MVADNCLSVSKHKKHLQRCFLTLAYLNFLCKRRRFFALTITHCDRGIKKKRRPAVCDLKLMQTNEKKMSAPSISLSQCACSPADNFMLMKTECILSSPWQCHNLCGWFHFITKIKKRCKSQRIFILLSDFSSFSSEWKPYLVSCQRGEIGEDASVYHFFSLDLPQMRILPDNHDCTSWNN